MPERQLDDTKWKPKHAAQQVPPPWDLDPRSKISRGRVTSASLASEHTPKAGLGRFNLVLLMASSPDNRPTDAVQRAFLQASSVCFLLYRNVLAGPAQILIPDHTRGAFFQLFCDLRTNSPKDRRWLERHLTALKPRTVTGWLALTSSLLFLTASMSMLIFTTSCALVGVLYVLMSLVAIAVVLSGAVLSTLAAALLVVAFLAGLCATAAAWGYVGLTTPGNLVKAFKQLQGQPGQQKGRRPRQVQPVSGSLAQPAGDKPAPSLNESTGTTSTDANLGAANPAAANMNYVEELSSMSPPAGLPSNQHSSHSSSNAKSPYM